VTYSCPVCDYAALPRPPEDHLICPSCGTQFGYHDIVTPYSKLREGWIAEGRLWHSRVIPRPETYICPVCGYPDLDAPPKDYMICSCCGNEFGYDDAYFTHKELRFEWLSAGAPWFSRATPPPEDWSLARQLAGLMLAEQMGVQQQSRPTLHAGRLRQRAR
jgi:ribosomal protein L37AE/L43A